MGLAESPWARLIGQVVLGTEQFALRLAKALKKADPVRKRLGGRPRWEQIVGAIEMIHGQKWEEYRDRHGDVLRDLVLHLARSLCGTSIRELSERRISTI